MGARYWRGWAEARTGWWRDDTKNNSVNISFPAAEFLTHRETLVTVDRISSLVALFCKRDVTENLSVHPVRASTARDEGAISLSAPSGPTRSPVKTLSTGENRLAQNRLPTRCSLPLCARPFNDARQPHNTSSPARTSFHPSSTLSRAARPRNSLSPRERFCLGPCFRRDVHDFRCFVG